MIENVQKGTENLSWPDFHANVCRLGRPSTLNLDYSKATDTHSNFDPRTLNPKPLNP